jgi:hypothetical protein
MISLADLQRAFEAGQDKVVVGCNVAGHVWVRAITDADLVASNPEEIDYHDIVELGWFYEVGGAVEYLRWARNLERAHAIALDMLARGIARDDRGSSRGGSR